MYMKVCVGRYMRVRTHGYIHVHTEARGEPRLPWVWILELKGECMS